MVSLISEILITLTFLASLAFVVIYHVLAKWRETSFGRSLMTYQVSMTALLGLSTVQGVIHTTSPVFITAGLVILATVPLALIWRIIVMIQLQRGVNDTDKSDNQT